MDDRAASWPPYPWSAALYKHAYSRSTPQMIRAIGLFLRSLLHTPGVSKLFAAKGFRRRDRCGVDCSSDQIRV